MSHFIQVYASPGGPLLADWTFRAQNVTVAYNEHGYLTLTAFVPMGRDEAFWFYDRAGLPQVELNSRWGTTEWVGRLEEVTIKDTGIDITAYGPWQALRDLPYTALWSDTKTEGWRPATVGEITGAFSDRFSFTGQNSIRISPEKNSTQGTGVLGYSVYDAPANGSRAIVQVTFDYELLAPAAAGTTWRGEMHFRDPVLVLGWQLLTNSTGVVQTGTVTAATSPGADRLSFRLFNTAAPAVYTGETDAVYLRIFNIRLTTSTTYGVSTTLGTTIGLQVNTTLGTVIAAGTRTVTPASMTNIVVGLRLNIGGTAETVTVTAITGTTFTAVFAQAHGAADTVQGVGSVTVTPPSMADIYVGQRLGIGSGATSESVVVTAITPTTFTAIYLLTHASSETVKASLIYADRIAVDTMLKVVAVNHTQLNSSSGLIQSPAIDLQQRIFEDAEAATILTDLTKLGDLQSRQWEVGVGDPTRALYFRPRGSGRTWYVDDATLEATRTIEELATGAYAVYADKNNRTLRTAVADDAYSTSRYGLTRRRSVKVDTTDLTEATTQRTVYLTDHAVPIPRVRIDLKQVFDAAGQPWPIWCVRNGDTLVLRRLSPVAGSGIDRIRSFRLSEVRLTETGIEVTPEAPVDQLETHVLQLTERMATVVPG